MAPSESVTRTVKLVVPVARGTPEIAPFATVSPGGSGKLVVSSDHV
jgi:hypothetical protein